MSGDASMDPNPNPPTRKKVKRAFCGRRKRRCRKKVKNVEEADSTPDGQLSESMEETRTASPPSVPKEEEEALTEGAERTSSTPAESPERPQGSGGVPDARAKVPAVRLRSVFAPLLGYLCEVCGRSFGRGAELVRHKRLHEVPAGRGGSPGRAAEPSFPCNMCERSFATGQSLKRHKLLHVRDGRRCPKCGLIFCQLHNHVAFAPLRESDSSGGASSEGSPGSPADEPEARRGDGGEPETRRGDGGEPEARRGDGGEPEARRGDGGEPEARRGDGGEPSPEEPESESEASVGAATTTTELPCEARNPLPPVSHRKIPKEIPLPKLARVTSPPVSGPPGGDDYVQLHLPLQPELRPALKVFSPQCLTSVLLEVRRNYEYILTKPEKVKKPKDQVTAYDLEIVL